MEEQGTVRGPATTWKNIPIEEQASSSWRIEVRSVFGEWVLMGRYSSHDAAIIEAYKWHRALEMRVVPVRVA